jgi:hypothetical protein
MGEVWTDQPLGVAGASGLNRVDLDWGADELVVEYGLGERRYLRGVTLGITTEQEICSVSEISIGLEPDAGGLGNSGDISEVSYTITEQSTDPNMIPVNPGDDVETGVRLMKVGTTCFIFTATEKSYTIAGSGVPPIPETALNANLSSYVTKAFAPAYGVNFSITIDSNAQISGWRQSKPKDDFPTWNVEATAMIENPSPSNSNILSPPTEVSNLIPSNMIGIYSQVLRMAKGKNNRATSSWTLTLYPTT